MNKTNIVIDLGSKNISIYKKDAGIVLKEPTVIVTANEKGSLTCIATGNDALALIGKLSSGQQLVYPIKEGAIINEKACEIMLKEYLAKIVTKSFFKSQIEGIICVSCGLTNVEKRTVEEVCAKAGISNITLLESPLAVANLTDKKEVFVVDIGGTKTEIAVISESGIILGCSIDIGGENLNQAISDYICDKYRMMIHYQTTEKVKCGIASMNKNDISSVTINGRSILDNSNKTIKLNAMEIREIILPSIEKIAEIIESVSIMIPDNMIEAIYQNGIKLCGGCANIPQIDKFLSEKLLINVDILTEPADAVVAGGAFYFYNKNKLSKALNVENL